MTTSATERQVSGPSALVWQEEIAQALTAARVDAVAFVPDTRLDGVLSGLAERGVLLRNLSREEECIAYACGRRIAGGRVAVLMQSSGLGNALNALGTLAVPYRLGIPLIISMRGTLGERNPSQVPIGRATVPMMAALGIQSFSLRSADQAQFVTAGVAHLAFDAGETAAVILEPELGGGRA